MPPNRLEENGVVRRFQPAARKEVPRMRLSFGLAFVFLTASVAAAQGGKAGGPPPLIDRDIIFGNPEVAAAELSPDGMKLATCGYDKQIEVWDASTGKLLRSLEGHTGAIYDQTTHRRIPMDAEQQVHSLCQGQ